MSIDLSKFIFIDHHAHGLSKGFLQLDNLAFRKCFSESKSVSIMQEHMLNSVHYLHMLQELGKLNGAADEDRLLAYRAEQREADYVNHLWDEVSIGAVIVDDGFATESMMTLPQMTAICERPIYRCRRIESALEEAIGEARSFANLVDLFPRKLLDDSPARIVALKTICGYRGGLQLESVSSDTARKDFDKVKAEFKKVKRITRGPLYHYFLAQAFALAESCNLPVQIHAGIGDDDADLLLTNPLLFRQTLADFPRTDFVFLHCYPYVSETAHLTSIHPHVYMDLSLAVSLVAPRAADLIFQALSAAPASKLLAASDGQGVPEAHWYGALSWKRALQKAMNRFVDGEFLSAEQAEHAAGLVLHDNARRLYGLEGLL